MYVPMDLVAQVHFKNNKKKEKLEKKSASNNKILIK